MRDPVTDLRGLLTDPALLADWAYVAGEWIAPTTARPSR